MNKCPTCSFEMEEYICNEYWDRHEDIIKEECGMWCKECKEDKTEFMLEVISNSEIKNMKEGNRV
jgi:hypothetical protein